MTGVAPYPGRGPRGSPASAGRPQCPIRTVAILRVTLVMFPPLNYALALSSIKFRDYVARSLLGLIPPILVLTVFFDQLMQWMGA